MMISLTYYENAPSSKQILSVTDAMTTHKLGTTSLS